MLISFFGDNQTITLGVCTNKRMDLIYLQDLFKIHICIALRAFYLLVLNSKISCSTTVMKKIWKWDRMNHRLSGDIWNKIYLGIQGLCLYLKMWVIFFGTDTKHSKVLQFNKTYKLLMLFWKVCREEIEKAEILPMGNSIVIYTS